MGILFDGGYAKAERINSTAYGYTLFYYNQDHLGNNREVLNSSGTIQQQTNYYPFGAPYTDPKAVVSASLQPFKYNGKELVTMHGLNTYDYGARQYYPILCRWDRVDPLAEKNPDITPYHYCHNNPVNRVDPDGKEVIDKLPAQTKGQEISKQNFFNRWHDKNNSIILMGHGGNNGKSFCIEDAPYIISANSPYGMAYFLEDNSQTWNIGPIASDKVELILFSCDTGSHDGLAENLSKQDEFQNISIFAPSEPININPDGSVSIDNDGIWREYKNGNVVNEYSGDTVPGTQEFDSSTIWEKITQNINWQK